MKKFFELLKSFKEKFAEGCVYCKLERKYGEKQATFPQKLDDMCSYIMDGVKYGEIDMGSTTKPLKDAMTDLNEGLSLAGEKPDKYLPAVWSNSYEEELLNTAFWGLICLNNTLKHRAKIAWYLNSQKVEFGISGYSQKLGKFLPCYFTEFDSYVFFIDPVDGHVYRSTQRVYGGGNEFKVYGNKLYKGNQLIAEETECGTLTFHIEKKLEEKDLKKSEKEKKKAEGKDIKDTHWLSSHLGTMFQHNCYIRTHTFICLMVFGFEMVKFSTMEQNSILTIDHTNSVHFDNRIDNLALCGRSANNSKKDKLVEIFDYFMYFSGLPQVEVKQEELSEEKVEKIEVEEVVVYDKMKDFNRELTADEVAIMLGCAIVG